MAKIILFNANGTNIKNPDSVEYDYYSLSKSGRVASGLMTMDIIAQKRKFVCKWDNINSTEWYTMMNAIFVATVPFYPLKYNKDNIITTATVYTGDIKKTLVRTGALWYYKDVQIDFIEQ